MAATTLISFEEFARLDSGVDDVELLQGVVLRTPPPENEHMDLCERLYTELNAAATGSKPGKIHIRRAWVYDASGAGRLERRSIHTHLLPGVEIPLSTIGLRPDFHGPPHISGSGP